MVLDTTLEEASAAGDAFLPSSLAAVVVVAVVVVVVAAVSVAVVNSGK